MPQPQERENDVITIKRATLIWITGALANLFIVAYAYGQLNERVSDQQKQLDSIQYRINWLYEHNGGPAAGGK